MKKKRLSFWAFLFALLLPNIVMAWTEEVPWHTHIAQLLFGAGLFGSLLAMGRNAARQFIRLFLFIFFGAFQLVLLWLYGNSPISADMFLNLVSTNANEAGELLGNIIVGVILVCTLYIGMIVWAVCEWNAPDPQRPLRPSLGLLASSTLLCIALQATTGMRVARDVYPVNVSCNMLEAIHRYYLLSTYDSRTSGFTFGTRPTHSPNERETYMLIIGETARSANFSLYGYHRPTNPRLARRTDLMVFGNAMSQSNTTHRSVPLMLTAAEASDPSPMYNGKSLIAAFREAGFHTIYLSNQADNGSLIDHYSHEAHTRRYVRREGRTPDDADLLAALADELAADKHTKRLIVIHTYGSHYKYCERVPASYRIFRPCDDKQLSARNREHLLNAYDNTILYTDMVVDSLITIADRASHGSMLAIYTSDHGEDIYDDGQNRFLHASPTTTRYQLAVPFIIAANEAYRTAHPDETRHMQSRTGTPVSPSRHVFHTLLGAAGVTPPQPSPTGDGDLTSPLNKE